MPTYDDPDYEWKQMVKKNGICDPYEESIREFKGGILNVLKRN